MSNKENYYYKWRSKLDYSDWEPYPEIEGTPFAVRRKFFETHVSHRNNYVVCPACGYPTLRERNSYDYCSLCCWDDDSQDDPWADLMLGGPNDSSLAVARENFETTSCVWSFAEADDFVDYNKNRLFSENAQKQKKILRELYDGLQHLKTDEEITKQWGLIEEQCKRLP